MTRETKRLLSIIQVFVEVAIAAGYLLGMIPFMYLVSCQWVIPLVFVSLILGFVLRNGTQMMAIGNIVMAFVSFIPIVGFITRLVGALLSFMIIAKVRRDL